MEKEIRTFSSGGMLWDDGEIPECSFCGKDFDKCDEELYETPYSGQLCCTDKNCMMELAQECFTEGQVEETTEEED